MGCGDFGITTVWLASLSGYLLNSHPYTKRGLWICDPFRGFRLSVVIQFAARTTLDG